MPRRTLFSCLFLVSLGCSDQGSPPVRPPPQDLWQSYGLSNYTIDQTRMCFCVERGVTMRVIVRADTVSHVIRVSDDSPVAPPLAHSYVTIDSLFSIVRNGRGDSIVAVYNRQYGYPEELHINPQRVPVDGGLSYTTSNLRIP